MVIWMFIGRCGTCGLCACVGEIKDIEDCDQRKRNYRWIFEGFQGVEW